MRGWGLTKAAAFEQAALALTAVVTDPSRVAERDTVHIVCEADDDELLLAAWLNAVITEMSVRRMLFARFQVELARPPAQRRGDGRARVAVAPPAGSRGQGRDLHGLAGRALHGRQLDGPDRGGCLIMDITQLVKRGPCEWHIPAQGNMRVPVVVFGTRDLVCDMDEKVREQAVNVASLPGIVQASYVMPDAHWGYGFPIGGVAAFDAAEGGVVSAGGVGFDVSCGVRCLLTGLTLEDILPVQRKLADALFERVPAGVGSRGAIRLNEQQMHDMLAGGARWAVEHDWGMPADLERTEERGQVLHAKPGYVSELARKRQREEMGTLGSRQPLPRSAGSHRDLLGTHGAGIRARAGRHRRHDPLRLARPGPPDRHRVPAPHGRVRGRATACSCRTASSRARRSAPSWGSATSAPCARRSTARWPTGRSSRTWCGGSSPTSFPKARMPLLYDVSHNTCKLEQHWVGDRKRELFVHRKGATRAFGPGHPELPEALRAAGQPVLIGGTMGTASYVLAGTGESETLAFSSACHGAGRAMSRHQALRHWQGRQVVDDLAAQGIMVRSVSSRGVAEEAPGAYKDVAAVVDAADQAGLARKVARLRPVICIKG